MQIYAYTRTKGSAISSKEITIMCRNTIYTRGFCCLMAPSRPNLLMLNNAYCFEIEAIGNLGL